MPVSVDDLIAMRDALIRARASGVRVTQYDGKRIEYASDIEMRAAINDLEARISRASGTRPALVRFSTSKGF